MELCSFFCAAFLHECGHYLAFLLCWPRRRRRGASFRFGWFGAELCIPPGASYRATVAVQLAGPGVNLLLYLLSVGAPSGCFWQLLGQQSLLLGILHLLPIRGLDGGAALEAIAAPLWGDRAAYRLLKITSFGGLFLLWLLSVCLLLLGSGNLSFFVLTWWLLSRQAVG